MKNNKIMKMVPDPKKFIPNWKSLSDSVRSRCLGTRKKHQVFAVKRTHGKNAPAMIQKKWSTFNALIRFIFAYVPSSD